jgi:hypothetical protein
MPKKKSATERCVHLYFAKKETFEILTTLEKNSAWRRKLGTSYWDNYIIPIKK